jgi:putative colanic acid biosysnthesis UDP-glucose lipid carrier transferase
VELFGDTSIPVVYAPHWSHPTMRFTVDSIGDQPCIDLWGSEQSLLDRQLKRSFDLLLTGIGVVVIAPLLLLIALAVRLSGPGPIFYRQDRYGLDGKRFNCFKFRSMRVLDSADQAVVKQATADDPRITPVGRFLRRWSLDELPQVFNVLLGDMSLVGPRPHAVQHNELYRKLIPGYMQRHAFKPGITGLAQVSGWRGETRNLSEMANRIDADLRYQRDWSLKLDIKILIKTFLRLRSGNAY